MFGDRRSFLTGPGWAWLTRLFPVGAAPAMARTRSVFDELGIQPIINFRGTHTTIGASKQWPELGAAMEEAARHYVSLDEVQSKVGERLSKLIGAEAAIVRSGTAGAVAIGTCAGVAGNEPKGSERWPGGTGRKKVGC